MQHGSCGVSAQRNRRGTRHPAGWHAPGRCTPPPPALAGSGPAPAGRRPTGSAPEAAGNKSARGWHHSFEDGDPAPPTRLRCRLLRRCLTLAGKRGCLCRSTSSRSCRCATTARCRVSSAPWHRYAPWPRLHATPAFALAAADASRQADARAEAETTHAALLLRFRRATLRRLQDARGRTWQPGDELLEHHGFAADETQLLREPLAQTVRARARLPSATRFQVVWCLT